MTPKSKPSAPKQWVASAPKKNLVVGMGEMIASSDNQASLVTYSLGSCVGVVVYDPVVRIGGMLHAMLPDSTISDERAKSRPFMFVDTGLPALFHAVYALGGLKHRLIVKYAGGAHFLDQNRIFNIGELNSAAVASILARNGVTPHAVECGGSEGRTLRMDLSTGNLTVEMSSQKPRLL